MLLFLERGAATCCAWPPGARRLAACTGMGWVVGGASAAVLTRRPR